LLKAVDQRDERGSAAKREGEPCDRVQGYLDESFLGAYFRNRQQRPFFFHNATNLHEYVEYVTEYLEPRSEIHEIYLKLLTYVNFIETPDPLVLIGNCMAFLKCPRAGFNFSIYDRMASARGAYNDVVARSNGERVRRVLPEETRAMLAALDGVFDSILRNAVAHNTYRLQTFDLKVWEGTDEKRYEFDDVRGLFESSYAYLDGFQWGVLDFRDLVGDECIFSWDVGERYPFSFRS
jgi:hypothetical protein